MPALLGALWLLALHLKGGPALTVHYFAGASLATTHDDGFSLDALVTVLFNATDVSIEDLMARWGS